MINDAFIKKIDNTELVEAITMVAGLGTVVFSSSLGQEDQVITDAIYRNQLPVKIFTIDTGRLFNETYELIEKTAARYRQQMDVFFPEAAAVEKYVKQHGVNGFYESAENRKSCCDIRKVKVLGRALQGANVWITGLRAEQSVNRNNMPLIEWDEHWQLYKFNPLLHWSYNDVMKYLERYNVPYNTLHDKGFISIGCAPCTRAIMPGEDARAGRWWWEVSHKECGLHATKMNAKV